MSRALESGELLDAFRSPPETWDVLRDGSLHVAESGEVSTDLAAGLYAFRRRAKEY